jgi:hypothetical protein
MRQQQQQDNGPDKKQSLDIIYSLCLMHQRAMVVPLRKGWGKEALGLPCLLALGLMFFWAGFSRDPLMWGYLGFWFLCQMVRRLESLRLAARGIKVHSRYDGWPHFALRIRGVGNENIAKLFVEPLAVFFAGLCFLALSDELHTPRNGLPLFLMLGIFSLPMVEGIKRMIRGKRVQSMMDARLEQQALMEEFKDRWGDS